MSMVFVTSERGRSYCKVIQLVSDWFVLCIETLEFRCLSIKS